LRNEVGLIFCQYLNFNTEFSMSTFLATIVSIIGFSFALVAPSATPKAQPCCAEGAACCTPGATCCE
jgi:hypothetical protein